MKLGVLGGTFDPIHIGHLLLAEEARTFLTLDQVLFIPAGRPWLKAGHQISESHHRVAMVREAVESNHDFHLSEMEICRPGPTYTLDTVAELRRQLGSPATIYLLLGLDSLNDLNRWHLPERLLELAILVGMARPGFLDLDSAAIDNIVPEASKRVILLRRPLISVSGTEIRKRVSKGLSIKDQVPEVVEKYIQEHGLYK